MRGGHAAAGKPRTQICGGCTFSRLLICACPGHVISRIETQTAAMKKDEASAGGENTGQDGQNQLLARKMTPNTAVQAARKAENAALKQLTLTPPCSLQRTASLSRWCSLCPALAAYACTTTPKVRTDKLKPEYRHGLPQNGGTAGNSNDKAVDTTAKAESANSTAGCGLRLCESCKTVFKVKRNDLGMTVKMLQEAVKMKGADMSWPRGLRADYEFLGTDNWMMVQCTSGWKR